MDPHCHPFDPDTGLIPEIVAFGPLVERSGGRGVILVAVPDVETPFWCGQAAAALIAAWSAQGAWIVLADVSLAQPVLHEVLDLPNSEGVTDVIMDGAQLRAVSQRVGSPGFLFMSAGTPTTDIASVMCSGQWDVVIKALEESDVDLVMYAPADLPGLDALLARGAAVVLLGRDSERAAEAIRALGLNEAPRLGPPVREVASAASAPPSGVRGAPTRDRKRSSFLPVASWKLVTAVGLLVLAVWGGSRALLTGATEPSESPAQQVDPPVLVVAPPPETPQAYSLSIAAFQDVSAAIRRTEGLAARRPDLLFTTVPVRVSGTVFHRILAGPARDSIAAEELRRSLGETLPDEDSSVWIVRATSLAFDLGEYESREAADRRAEEEAVVELAPYVFEFGPPDGVSFRVYAGAYADHAEASVVLAQFMESGQQPPPLVRRVGRYVVRP